MTKRHLHAGLAFAIVMLSAAITANAQVDLSQISENRRTPVLMAVQRGLQSTVNIHSEKLARSDDTLFSAGGDRRVNGMGTGIVIDERGYIVTNQHVVADVESLEVTLSTGRSI